MAEYKDLATLYHMDSSSQREANLQKILRERKESDSSYELDLTINGDNLFLAVPRELNDLTQKVLRRERKVSKLMQFLPGIAQSEVLRGLVVDEVVMSNSIENIHSTRRQIEESLTDSKTSSTQSKRFRELALLYIELSEGNFIRPETIEDIRAIYDRVMAGESNYIQPDGILFRKDEVVVSNGIKQVHGGVVPESRIIEILQAMLELVNSREVPGLYSALISHFIFEYVHPFYDGNGRTGRYLLAVYLEEILSKPTVLSLSRIIAENKDSYYKAFRRAEESLNHGELTFFVMVLLELILAAQDELISRFNNNIERYEQINRRIDDICDPQDYSEKETDLIFGLAQQSIFGVTSSSSVKTLADFIGLRPQQTSKYLARLEKNNVVQKTRKRNPVAYALTDEFEEKLFN